jgi:hypothetical protein
MPGLIMPGLTMPGLIVPVTLTCVPTIRVPSRADASMIPAMDAQTFQATIERSEESGTGTFVKVPLDVRALFGRARPPVRVTIGTHTFRTTIAVYGGEYYVGVNRATCEAAGVAVGDAVTVTVAYDDEPRVVEPPDDLAAALRSGGVLDTWSRLSYSHQREYVAWIDAAARPETRARRVTQTVERIGAGLRRR